jgi:hypothetical protein
MTSPNQQKNLGYLGIATGLILTSAGFWYSLVLLLNNPYQTIGEAPIHVGSLVVLLLSFICYITLIINLFLLVKESLIQHTIIIVVAMCKIAFLFNSHHIFFILLTVLIEILALEILRYRIHVDLKKHLKPYLNHIFHGPLNILVIGFAFSISLLLYESGLNNINSFSPQVPENFITSVLDFSKPFLNDQIQSQQSILIENAIGQIDQQIPVLQQANNEDKKMLLEGKVTANLRRILNEQGITDTQIDQLAQQLSLDFLDLNQNLEENLSTNFFDQIKQQVTTMIEKTIQGNKQLAPWIISSITFFLFNSLGYIMRSLSIFLAFGTTKVLLASNVIKEEQQEAVKTSYTFK